jgi:hypothetical protein
MAAMRHLLDNLLTKLSLFRLLFWGRWIRVEDDLPEIGEVVFVVVTGGFVPDGVFMTGIGRRLEPANDVDFEWQLISPFGFGTSDEVFESNLYPTVLLWTPKPERPKGYMEVPC